MQVLPVYGLCIKGVLCLEVFPLNWTQLIYRCLFIWKAITTKERKRFINKLTQINIIAQADHKRKSVRPQRILSSKHSLPPFPEFPSVYEILSSTSCVSWHLLHLRELRLVLLLSWYFCNRVIFDLKTGHCWASPSRLLQHAPSNSRKEN